MYRCTKFDSGRNLNPLYITAVKIHVFRNCSIEAVCMNYNPSSKVIYPVYKNFIAVSDS